MSYQSTTPNFDLPQWVYSDPPQMNDFNTAFANIDEKAIPNDEKGAANGVATLNSSGKLAQMPSASDVGALPITGGEMQGALKLKANQYGGSGPADEKYALDCQNSNIVNVNRILTADPAGSASEGWGFQREDDPDAYDVIWASNGTLYFTPGFKYNTPPYPANQKVLTDNINAAISARHQYTSSSYPQIYGNGILHLGGDPRFEYGVVLRCNGTDEANAFRPSVNAGITGHLYLGTANQKWRAVFAQDGTIQTSDRNAKHDISGLDPEKITAFIMGLKPSSYVFNDADSGRTHWGLISQDIEELFPQLGMTSMDFAGFIKSPKTEDYYEDVPETVTDEETGEEKTVTRKELKTRTVEGEYIYSLRYDEFIAPLICMVQRQQKQIQDLERRLSALESKEEAK